MSRPTISGPKTILHNQCMWVLENSGSNKCATSTNLLFHRSLLLPSQMEAIFTGVWRSNSSSSSSWCWSSPLSCLPGQQRLGSIFSEWNEEMKIFWRFFIYNIITRIDNVGAIATTSGGCESRVVSYYRNCSCGWPDTLSSSAHHSSLTVVLTLLPLQRI